MQIGELAKRAGVAIDTVRYYEREGLVPKPLRQRSGYRRYEEDDAVNGMTCSRLRKGGKNRAGGQCSMPGTDGY